MWMNCQVLGGLRENLRADSRKSVAAPVAHSVMYFGATGSVA